MKLKNRLTIVVVALLVVSIGVVAFVLLDRASRVAMSLSDESSLRLARERAVYWKGREEGLLRIVETVASVMNDYKQIDVANRRRQYNEMMRGIIGGVGNIVEIYSVWKPGALDGLDAQYAGQIGASDTGQYAAAYSRVGGVLTLKTADNIRDVINRMASAKTKSYLTDPKPFTADGKTVLAFDMVTQIYDKDTTASVGVVSIKIDISQVQTTLEDTFKSNEDIKAMEIYTADGTIAGSYRPDTIGKNMETTDTALYGDDTKNLIDAMHANTVFRAVKRSERLKTTLNIIVAPFTIGATGTRWAVMVGTDQKFVLSPIEGMKVFAFIVAVALAALIGGIVFYVVHHALAPLAVMATTMEHIAAGDLTKRVDVKSDDEIGEIAQAFDQTVDAIKHLVRTIRERAGQMSDISANLSNSMTETAAAINEITANIQSIKSQVLNQSASVNETSATMKSVTANIEKLDEQVEKQSEHVQRSSAAVEELLASIKSVVATLDKSRGSVATLDEASSVGRESVTTVSNDISEIAEESASLLEINAVMQNIASQTNLLSMNASIEAAHAGDAGAGFAVVAGEIRNLAESSSNQSKTISAALKKIKNSIDKITASTSGVLSKFDAIAAGVRTVLEQTTNIHNAMNEQNAGSQQILDVINTLNDISREVEASSDVMLEGSKQVIVESERLERLTHEMTTGITEMAAGADEINHAVQQLSGVSSENKAVIAAFMQEIARFKVD